jgi:hypothetical protein
MSPWHCRACRGSGYLRRCPAIDATTIATTRLVQMLRTIIFMIMLAWPLVLRAEVVATICPNTDPAQAKRVADAIKGLGQCQVRCKGCGCKAGPGYRMPGPPTQILQLPSRKKGECAAWVGLERQCGKGYGDCTAECTKVVFACRDREAFIESILRPATSDTNEDSREPAE